jgi:hypothetical protein
MTLANPRRWNLCVAFAACALAFSCASQIKPQPRVLAVEHYWIREGDAIVGKETFTLSARSDYGKLLRSTVEREAPWKCKTEIEAQLAPDWSIVKLDARFTDGDGTTQTLRASADGDDHYSTRASAGGETRRGGAEARMLLFDSAALAMVWTRTQPLEPGQAARVSAVRFDPATLASETGTATVERGADRGRRLSYHLRFRFHPWIEIESDHRDVPFFVRFGPVAFERRINAE